MNRFFLNTSKAQKFKAFLITCGFAGYTAKDIHVIITNRPEATKQIGEMNMLILEFLAEQDFSAAQLLKEVL